MLNKKLVATLLVGCFGFATAQAENVTVNFTGQVVGSVCTLQSSATSVDLGVIKDNEQEQTTAKQFTVSLVNCGQGVKTASVKVSSASSTYANNVLKATNGTGKANIAFYTNATCSDKLVLQDGFGFTATATGTDPNVLYTMNASKDIWVRLEKADTPEVGTISEHVVFTAEYQ